MVLVLTELRLSPGNFEFFLVHQCNTFCYSSCERGLPVHGPVGLAPYHLCMRGPGTSVLSVFARFRCFQVTVGRFLLDLYKIVNVNVVENIQLNMPCIEDWLSNPLTVIEALMGKKKL